MERGFLAPLPDPLLDTDWRTKVTVTKDGFCRVKDVDYSVPQELSSRRVRVRASWPEVVIFSEGTEVARQGATQPGRSAHARALRLAREAQGRLQAADFDVPEIDLSHYDELVEAAP